MVRHFTIMQSVAAFMLVCAVVAAPVLSAAAQGPARDLEAQQRAMAAIAGLKGNWIGEGWRIMPDGKRITFIQTVAVTPKTGGLAFTIEGRSLERENPAAKPGGGSLGVISFDDRAGGYRLRSFSRGELTDAPAELVRPGVFRWRAETPQSVLQFTVDVAKDGVWVETGDRSTDGGQSWTKTYEVSLKREPRE
ncbi:hypothetical protein VB735_18410 [Halotia wernerae UHCC 0503]|nr:hypothetical protein [Halotia wernerae UHCC 0503]